mgnify:CR=1 FL=1
MYGALPLVVFGPPLFLQRLSYLRRYAVHKPPKLFIFLFQHEHFHLLLYALFAVDLFLQVLVLLGQIVDGGLVFLHLPQVLFQPGEVRPHQFQNLVPLLPGVQHPDFRNGLFDGPLLAGEVDRLLEQPGGDMLPLGDKGALAPLEAGERPVHVGVILVLPLGKLRPVAQNLLGGQPPVLGDGGKAQVEMGRFLVHVNHGGKNIAPAHLPLHERRRLGEVGLHLPPAPAREELRAGGDKGVYEHGAVLPGAAPRRPDTAVDFPAVLLCGPDDVKILPAPVGVNVRVAGVLLLGALVVGLQRPGWPRLAFSNLKIACCAILPPYCSFLGAEKPRPPLSGLRGLTALLLARIG